MTFKSGGGGPELIVYIILILSFLREFSYFFLSVSFIGTNTHNHFVKEASYFTSFRSYLQCVGFAEVT